MNGKQDVSEQQLAPQDISQMGPYSTAVAYVAQFYPLWFTYNQSRFATHNRLVGPDQVTPLYQIVVAINVDTLYASTFLEQEGGKDLKDTKDLKDSRAAPPWSLVSLKSLVSLLSFSLFPSHASAVPGDGLGSCARAGRLLRQRRSPDGGVGGQVGRWSRGSGR